MSRALVLRRIAQREFGAAVDWYTQRRARLAQDFIAEVERILARFKRG